MKFPGSKEPKMDKPATLESGDVEIVELGTENWAELKSLRLQALKDTPRAYGHTYDEEASYSEQDWRNKLMKGRYLCAKKDGKLVAMLCMVRDTGEKTDHKIDIFSVFVSPDVRRQGIGRALFEHAFALLADGRTRKISLHVDAESGAKDFYESMGFVEAGRLKDELKEGNTYIDELVMEKYLA